MPLTDAELRELRNFLRDRVRSWRLGEYDARAADYARRSESAFQDLELYLDHLIRDLAAGSRSEVDSIMDRMREMITTEDGARPAAIVVDLDETLQRQYDRQTIPLTRPPEWEEGVEQLAGVLAALREERQRGYGGSNLR